MEKKIDVKEVKKEENILKVLEKAPMGMSLEQLAVNVGTSKITIKPALARLEERGTITVRPIGQVKLHYLTKNVRKQ